jgi:hypothetical protein
MAKQVKKCVHLLAVILKLLSIFHRYNMKSTRTLNLALRELAEVPEEIFHEAVQAEVSTVDICKNQLTAFPLG